MMSRWENKHKTEGFMFFEITLWQQLKSKQIG